MTPNEARSLVISYDIHVYHNRRPLVCYLSSCSYYLPAVVYISVLPEALRIPCCYVQRTYYNQWTSHAVPQLTHLKIIITLQKLNVVLPPLNLPKKSSENQVKIDHETITNRSDISSCGTW